MDNHEFIDERIKNVCNEIIAVQSPAEIYLIGTKINVSSKLKDFKLAVIVGDDEDIYKAEDNIYRSVDCEIPFELIVYNKTRFENLSAQKYSYASRITEKGYKMYGQEQK